MPRDRRRDPDSGEFPRSRKPGVSPVVIILAVLGGAFVLCAGGVVAFFWVGTRVDEATQKTKEEKAAKAEGATEAKTAEKAAAKPAAKIWSKREFEAAVLNKTKEEVIAAVGRPAGTRSVPPDRRPGVLDFGHELWFYYDLVQNEATGKTHPYVAVAVNVSGVVFRVRYP